MTNQIQQVITFQNEWRRIIMTPADEFSGIEMCQMAARDAGAGLVAFRTGD